MTWRAPTCSASARWAAGTASAIAVVDEVLLSVPVSAPVVRASGTSALFAGLAVLSSTTGARLGGSGGCSGLTLGASLITEPSPQLSRPPDAGACHGGEALARWGVPGPQPLLEVALGSEAACQEHSDDCGCSRLCGLLPLGDLGCRVPPSG